MTRPLFDSNLLTSDEFNKGWLGRGSVLECGSPLPLSIDAGRSQSSRGRGRSKTSRKIRRFRGGISARFIVATIVSVNLATAGENWPQFRGPDGNGHSDSTGLPLTWSETDHVKWKTPIHGRAWSSPVIWGNQVWMTTATPDGTELSAICVDRDTGRIVHDLKLFDVEAPQYAHPFNSYASPTPVIEEGRVYVTFGSPGTACLDTKTGRVLWERRDFVCNHFRGAGSSPVLFGNLLVMHFDGSDLQYVVALDKTTGKTVWKTDRSVDYRDLGADGKPRMDGDFRKAFATPQVAVFDGKPQIISVGSRAVYGYAPLTGKELWRVEEHTTYSSGTRPVVGDGLVFATTGWASGRLLGIRPGAKGESIDATEIDDAGMIPLARQGSLEVVWKVRKNVSRKPSLVLVNGLIYSVEDDGGIVSCLEAGTGKEVWRERVRGNHSASPLHAEGRIYFFDEKGQTTVIEAGRHFKPVATNQLGDGFMASPAVSGKALFLRSKTQLYRVEN
jgi:outer membrane protein assembly factor BamB